MEFLDSEEDLSELFDLPLINEYTADPRFVSRDWLKDRIEAELTDPECRIVLVTGDPGAGKTSLMAWLAAQWPDQPRYFIRRIGEAEAGDAHRHEGSLSSFLTVVGLQLATDRSELFPSIGDLLKLEGIVDIDAVLHGGRATAVLIDELVTHPFRKVAAQVTLKVGLAEGEVFGVHVRRLVDGSQDPERDLTGPALFEPARRLAEDFPDQRIVILLDGLDELRFRTSALDVGRWLTDSARLPSNVRLVVTSRHDDQRLLALRRGQRASLREIRIDPASQQVREDIESYANLIAADPRIATELSTRGIHPERFVRQAVNKAGGSFQYLAFLARALETSADTAPGDTPGAHELDWLHDLESLPAKIGDLYELFLARVRDRVVQAAWGGAPWQVVYQPVLGLLTVARASLSAGQIAVLADIGGGQRACLKALATLGQFLDRDQSGRYRLFHASVADFLDQERTDRNDPDADLHVHLPTWHRRITEHAIARHADDGSWRALDPYLQVYLASHAAEIGRLAELMEDPRYLVAADPTGLMEMFRAVRDTPAAPLTQLYRRVLSLLQSGDEANALSHLAMYARHVGHDSFAARIEELGVARPWSMAWTRWGTVAVRQVLGQHGAEVTAIAVANDDGVPLAVSGGTDGHVRVWNLRDSEPVGYLTHGLDEDRYQRITALAVGELNNGEPFVVSGGGDGSVRAWNLASRTPIGPPMTGIESAQGAIAVSDLDADPVAVCFVPDTVRAWNLVTGAALGPAVAARNAEHAAIVRHQGRVLLAVAENPGPGQGVVHVWDARDGELAGQPLPARESWINALGIGLIDGEPVVAVCDGGHTVQAVDLKTSKPRSRRLTLDATVDAVAVGMLSGRPTLVVGDRTGTLRLWDLAADRLTCPPFPAHPHGGVSAIAFLWTPEGDALLTCGEERGANAPTATQLALLDSPDPLVRHRQERELLTTSPALRLWPAGKFATTGRITSGAPVPLDAKAKSIAPVVVSDRALVAVTGSDRVVLLRDPSTGNAVTSYFASNSMPEAEFRMAYNELMGRRAAPLFYHGEGSVRALAAGNLHGEPVAVSVVDGVARVWSAEHGVPVGQRLSAPLLGPGQSCYAMAVVELSGRPVVVSSTGIVASLETGMPTGAQLPNLPRRVSAFAIGLLRDRTVAAFGARNGVALFDIETGEPIQPPHPGHWGDIHVVAIASHEGACLVVTGAHDRTLRVWDPDSGDQTLDGPFGRSPHLINVSDDLRTLAVAEIDGNPVAVCSGRSGSIRLVDLAAARDVERTDADTKCVAVGWIDGRAVLVSADQDGLHTVDVTTGALAGPPPVGIVAGHLGLVTTGELHGRPVGLCVDAEGSIRTWYLDTGEPASLPPITPPGGVGSMAVARLDGRAVLVTGGRDHSVRFWDLETGSSAREAIEDLGEEVIGVGLVRCSGREVLVYARSAAIRGWLLNPADIDEAAHLYHGTSDWEDTPPPPPRLKPVVNEALHGSHSGGRAMAIGAIGDVPVVASGHDDGAVDIYTVETALPIRPPFDHQAPVTSVAFGEMYGRPIVISGGFDGIVRIWDLATGSELTVIHTLVWVKAIQFAPPDHFVIGTEKGVLSLRIDRDWFDSTLAGAPAAVPMPVDVRGARMCPQHGEHLARIGRHMRMCIKGIQLGHPAMRALAFAQGHCYVLDDRIVITEAVLEPDAELVLRLEEIFTEPDDLPWAYQYDGGHFGIIIHTFDSYSRLCCYGRAERNQLLNLIRRHS